VIASPSKLGQRFARGSVLATGFAFLWACSSATQDVVPASRDVVLNAGAASSSPRDYEFVVRRPLGTVALAEARGVDATAARAMVERLADALDTCVGERHRAGGSIAGAARLVVRIGANGRIAAARLRLDPGLARGAAETAVLCLAAPAKTLVFPASDSEARGFAIEAIWGQPSPEP